MTPLFTYAARVPSDNAQSSGIESLPQLLPSETLYSWGARRHRLLGTLAHRSSTDELYGHRRVGAEHDLPRRVDELINRTGGWLGDARSLIVKHTLYGFYRPFITADLDERLIGLMRHGNTSALKPSLGLLYSRFGLHHPLKACTTCQKQDTIRYGCPTWRVIHQSPGVWWCLEHDEALRETAVKTRARLLEAWLLPDRTPLHNTYVEERAVPLLRRIAELGRDFVHVSGTLYLDRVRLAATYRNRISQRGELDSAGRVRAKSAAADYASFIAPLRTIPEFAALPFDCEIARRAMHALFAIQPRDRGHPIRHLTYIAWLFSSFADWRDTYDRAEETRRLRPADPEAHAVTKTSHSDQRRGRLHELVSNQGHSVTAAARLIGIPGALAAEWAVEDGLPYRSTPRRLAGERLVRALEALASGASLPTVAQLCGVSRTAIGHLRRRTPGMVAKNSSARFRSQQAVRRAQWLEAADRTEGRRYRDVCALVPDVLRWLRANDRVWLSQQRAILAASVERRPHVNWDERDTEFADAITRLETEAQAQGYDHDGRPLNLRRILDAIPDLEQKLRSLHRMPLTRVRLSPYRRKRPAAYNNSLPLRLVE